MLHLDGVGASSALVAEHGGNKRRPVAVNAGLEEEPARAVRRTVGEASSGTTATGARCFHAGERGRRFSVHSGAVRWSMRLEGAALETVGLGADPGGDAGERGLVPGAAGSRCSSFRGRRLSRGHGGRERRCAGGRLLAGAGVLVEPAEPSRCHRHGGQSPNSPASVGQ